MANPSSPAGMRSKKALEMIMRDVQQGLEQAACLSAWAPGGDDMQILSLTAECDTPPLSPAESRPRAGVQALPPRRSANVLEFLLEREYRRRA